MRTTTTTITLVPLRSSSPSSSSAFPMWWPNQQPRLALAPPSDTPFLLCGNDFPQWWHAVLFPHHPCLHMCCLLTSTPPPPLCCLPKEKSRTVLKAAAQSSGGASHLCTNIIIEGNLITNNACLNSCRKTCVTSVLPVYSPVALVFFLVVSFLFFLKITGPRGSVTLRLVMCGKCSIPQ